MAFYLQSKISGFILFWLLKESMAGQNIEQGEQVLQHVCHFLQRLSTLLCAGFSSSVIENVDEIEG